MAVSALAKEAHRVLRQTEFFFSCFDFSWIPGENSGNGVWSRMMLLGETSSSLNFAPSVGGPAAFSGSSLVARKSPGRWSRCATCTVRRRCMPVSQYCCGSLGGKKKDYAAQKTTCEGQTTIERADEPGHGSLRSGGVGILWRSEPFDFQWGDSCWVEPAGEAAGWIIQ